MLTAQVLVASALIAGASTQPAATAPTFTAPSPTAASAAAWREHVLPTPGELRWESIPWIPSFNAGFKQAQQEGRPYLFWAMNGHPLGCT